MEGEAVKGTESSETGIADKEKTEESNKPPDFVEGQSAENEHEKGEHVEGLPIEGKQVGGEHVEDEHVEGDHVEGEHVEGEHVEGEHVEGEHVDGEHVEGEHKEGEHDEGEYVDGEHVEVEELEGQQTDREHVVGEQGEGDEKVLGECEEITEEEVEGDNVEELKEEPKAEEPVLETVEEEQYVEEPPPDPAAPLNLSDSNEALKPKFELRPDQLAEVEKLWEGFQNYTPCYAKLDDFVTEKELVYMLNSLLLMTYTPEQLQELIAYCCIPPHPNGYITYEHFLKMVTLRQRDLPIEEELHKALEVLDPDHDGLMDRDYFKDVLLRQGHKMIPKQLDNFVKEVDIANDGTVGIEDVVGTLCIDLNRDDIIMMQTQLNPQAAPDEPTDEY